MLQRSCEPGIKHPEHGCREVCRVKLVNHLIIYETLGARLQELLNLPTVAAA